MAIYFVAMLALPLLLGSPQLIYASLLDDELPDGEPVEIEATLNRMVECEGSEDLSYRFENAELVRISPDVVAVNADIYVKKVIPATANYVVEATIENIPGNNENERVMVASMMMPDICGELKSEEKEGFRSFKDSLEDSEAPFECPVQTGMYRVQNLTMNIEDARPFLREGRMEFTVKHIVEGQVISCSIIEFLVHMDI